MSQNPEQNVRTRDELIGVASVYISRHNLLDCWQDVDDMVNEVMKAGAAEQRRKDAEGLSIAGYVPDNTPNFFSASEARHTSTALHRDPFPGDVPVYYTPAYVAWREERVKTLEEALRRIAESELFCGSQTLRHIARAALTREGGV